MNKEMNPIEALTEIERRTGLLINQNTGRWNMGLEHDLRTVSVLNGNQEIANAALQSLNTTPGEDVVTQEDRKLFIAICGFEHPDIVEGILAGHFDHWPKLQLLRAHRVNASPLPDMTGEMERALREIVSDMAEDDAAGTLNWGHAKDALETARAALLAARGAA